MSSADECLSSESPSEKRFVRRTSLSSSIFSFRPAGRAGRTQPGECYRLFTRCHERLFFLDFPQAEMVTSRLDNIYLQGKLLNITDVKSFLQDALDPPSSEAVEHAERFLVDIGALLVENNQLTPMGRILAQ